MIELLGDNMTEQNKKLVDMSANTMDNFIVRMGHYQDHQRKTRSLFAQTTINEHKYWGWSVLVDKDGFRTSEKRPAIQTIGDLFVSIFKDHIMEVINQYKEEGKVLQGIHVEEHYGEDLPVFNANLHSKEFEAILDELGFKIFFNRSRDKPRIETVRIVRKV